MPTDTPPIRSTRSGSVSGITLQDIKTLVESSENRVVDSMKRELDGLKETITSLSTKICSLESQQQLLQSKYDEVCGELTSLKKDQILMVSELSNEIEEQVRRSQNFVISGIPESDAASLGSSLKEDVEKNAEVLRTIGCDPASVVEVHRIGRPNRERPRLLRVKCTSVGVKESVLRNAKNLRKSPKFKGVYINPDRSPLQQRFWKDLYDELKKRREQGEDVIIFRNRITRRRDAKN